MLLSFSADLMSLLFLCVEVCICSLKFAVPDFSVLLAPTVQLVVGQLESALVLKQVCAWTDFPESR